MRLNLRGTAAATRHSPVMPPLWHTSGVFQMRNYITPDHFDLSDTTTEARHVSSVANSNQRLGLVHDDRNGKPAGSRSDMPGKVVQPSPDFEGFGSFSG
jgi:hypothetical protein